MSQQSRWVLFSCTILASGVFLMGQGCPAEMPLPGPAGPEGPAGAMGTMGTTGPAGVSPFMTAANGTDIFYNLGNVGIGTNAPGALLDVRGNIRLGAAGEFNAVAGDGGESLRLIRGTVKGSDATVIRGTGWTVARTPAQATGDYTITFTTAFSDFPTVTATAIDSTVSQTAVTSTVMVSSIRIITFDAAAAKVDTDFTFIAVGPR